MDTAGQQQQRMVALQGLLPAGARASTAKPLPGPRDSRLGRHPNQKEGRQASRSLAEARWA